MSQEKIEFVSNIEFIADIDENKDCIMNQSTSQDSPKKDSGNPSGLWFNIDVPKSHSMKMGDRVRITVEKID
ncbi:hypothetical protein J2128_000234 [Methanomicrobium sp. W14]|uniref:hypothetical protein n=1 Tax=Methanomicrobium sp. W14 TaxID=2817839 RepID=UPI001AE8EE54|nr:hypothetical protein [Methanomicrobium sp. W14]MBP2132313.1 hypothetical protein [Methanomicrobium sp. W14]